MNLVHREPWTVARFLDWEDSQEGTHEFDGAQIIDMTGGSRAHQRIVGNLLRWFEDNVENGWSAFTAWRSPAAMCTQITTRNH